MVLAQDFLPDLQCLAEERFGPPIVALVLIQAGQIVQAVGIIGVVLAQDFLPDLQCLAEERLGPRIVALGQIQVGQIVQAGGIIGVVLAQDFLTISNAWRKSGSACG